MFIAIAIVAAFIAGILLSAGIKSAVKKEQDALLKDALAVRDRIHPPAAPAPAAPAPVETPAAPAPAAPAPVETPKVS